MDLTEAERLAKRLMARHGLSTWRFAFDDGKALGVCHYNVGLITLNPSMVRAGEVAVKAVLLHEIAHALVSGERKSHGPIWHAKLVNLIREHTWGK